MSILGNRVLRKEDPKFLTTGGVYAEDLRAKELDGALQVTYVRSTMAHARIGALETDGARQVPGVVDVVTGADVDLPPAPMLPMFNPAMTRPWLATDVVRYVGEPLVAILSEDRASGADAVEMVFVDYEPLPPVIGAEAALAEEAILHPDAGTNVAISLDFGRDEHLFDGCEVVIRHRAVNQRVAPCPLEVRSGAAAWAPDGRLVQWASTQGPQDFRDGLAAIYGLEPGQVRLIAPDVGGAFGAKISAYLEEALLGWLARRAGRPVRWVETRSESMTSLGHGRAQIQELELGGTKDGKVLAYRLSVLQDCGAYPAIGGTLPFFTRTMAAGTYVIPRVEFKATAVVTSTTPTVAYRGAGRPEATAAIERAMDLFAAEVGLDPTDVRRRNLIQTDAFPFTTAVGTTYDSGDYRRALDLALEAAGYRALREEQAQRRTNGSTKVLGIGVSCYVEITNGAGSSGEFGSVEVTEDGKAVVRTGTSPHGQGHATAWAMLASEQLAIPIDDIEVRHGDTDEVPSGGGTMASRSLQAGGLAVHEAAGQVVEMARRLAAELLEASADDVVLDKVSGQFQVAGTPTAAKSWGELAGAAAGRSGDGAGLKVEHTSSPPGPTFPFGTHVAVVEVDLETGAVDLLRLVAVDDAGRLLNPLLVEGQVHGGLAQGAAQALLETFQYDADGTPVTANLADYAMISAAELPSFELLHTETPTPVNTLGAKGIGESGTIGSTPAVQNAVIDALGHLGIRHLDMPVSNEVVWKAVQQSHGNRA